MNALFPSDNEYGIPSLRLDRQAKTVAAPVIPWGAVARTTQMQGTWSLYVDDHRFSALLKNPSQLAPTGCTAAVEPNVTVYDQSTVAEAIWATFRKRRAARVWQDSGVDVFVDLNVPEIYRYWCMLGVPKGWRAFGTRGYARRLEDLESEYDYARSWAGGEPLFLVVGGGAPVAALCRQMQGAIWIPDDRQERLRAVKPLREAANG